MHENIITQLVRELERMIEIKLRETPQLRQGVVTAVTNPTVTVRLGGGSVDITGVHRLASYTPTTSDTVWVLVNGVDLLVLGKVA